MDDIFTSLNSVPGIYELLLIFLNATVSTFVGYFIWPKDQFWLFKEKKMHLIRIESFHGCINLLPRSGESREHFGSWLVTMIPKGKKISKVDWLPSQANLINFSLLEMQWSMDVGSVIGHKILFGVSLSFVIIKNCRWARGRLSSLRATVCS